MDRVYGWGSGDAEPVSHVLVERCGHDNELAAVHSCTQPSDGHVTQQSGSRSPCGQQCISPAAQDGNAGVHGRVQLQVCWRFEHVQSSDASCLIAPQFTPLRSQKRGGCRSSGMLAELPTVPARAGFAAAPVVLTAHH